MDLKLDYDVTSAANDGELWVVQDAAARRVVNLQSELDAPDGYGIEWIFVRAESSAQAIIIAAAYDDATDMDLRNVAEMPAVVEAA